MTDNRVSFAFGHDQDAAISSAEAWLRRDGVVVLDDMVDPSLIATCRAEIEAAYPDMERVDPLRNFGPYVGRHTMPIRVAGTLADPAIFMPPVVGEIAGRLLGDRFKLDSLGLLVSVTGAPEQKAHPDANLFFDGTDRLIPAFAMAFALPLVPMDEVSGTTAFWRGSHRKPEVGGSYDLAPIVQPGSAILWDYRVVHGGLANRGSRPRPVVFSAFSREWWIEIDPPGASEYEKLLVARDVHAALDPQLQFRISRARLVD